MPAVLILCAHRPKRSPSQRYRFEQYLHLLEKEGFSFTFSYLLNERDDKLFYSKGNFLIKAIILIKSVFIRFKDIFRFKKYDVIFIQREATFFGTSFFEKRAYKSGAYVIFDFDDSIWLADTSPGNKKWEWIKKPEKFYKNVSYAHTVIAGNSYLAERALKINKNVIVIPTTVDTDIHIPKPELRGKEVLTIGWSGSISTVKHFDSLVPVLLDLKEKYKDKIKFKVLGDENYSNPSLDVEPAAWTEETEVNELNSFDIGIMPLPDNEWEWGKCGLKGLTYMACEIPAVLSAVGVNRQIINEGQNGFTASSGEEWYKKLCLLIEDKMLRERFGRNARQTVIEKYSVTANKHLYLEVFKNVQRRR
jgi:glycosyltransferase involved in cell wall biosynthesis